LRAADAAPAGWRLKAAMREGGWFVGGGGFRIGGQANWRRRVDALAAFAAAQVRHEGEGMFCWRLGTSALAGL